MKTDLKISKQETKYLDQIPESIKDYLVEKIAVFTDDTGTSLLTLSETSGVKYDTLLAIANQNKRQNPTEGTAGRLIRIIEKKELRTAVLIKYFPYLKEYLHENPGSYFTMEENTRSSHQVSDKEVFVTSKEVDDFMDDSVCYQIYTLAGFESGITVKDIKKHFGLLGVAKLKKLLDKKILKTSYELKDENPVAVVRTHHKFYRSLTVENLLNKIQHGLDIYSEQPPNEDCRYIGVYASEFDERDRLEIRESLKTFSTLIAKINKRKKVGKTKGMYINFFAGDFLPKKEENLNE